jgi:hypothetical protein
VRVLGAILVQKNIGSAKISAAGEPSHAASTEKIPGNAGAVLRATSEFYLRGVESVAATLNGDIFKSFVFSAMWVANVQHLTNSAANMTYGAFDNIPPDELRRPVSVLSISQSLRIPYETTRRCVGQLLDENTCIRVGGEGLVVPAAVHLASARTEVIVQQYVNLRRYMGDLKRAGMDLKPYLSAAPLRAASPHEFSPNVRALLRIGTEYLLYGLARLEDLCEQDFVPAMLFTAIWTSNLARIPLAQTPEVEDTVLADALRRPVPVLALANSLHVPYETVRRHINRMEREGLCKRIGKEGVIVPRAVLLLPRFQNAAASFYPRVLRYLTDLQRVQYDFDI